MVGKPPKFNVNINKRILILMIGFLGFGSYMTPQASAQDALIANAVVPVSSNEKLHALSLTRFHFITLKQVHSALFTEGEQKGALSQLEARLLNAALNSFLTSSERENMLLQALREDKAVRLEFSVPEVQEGYDMVVHPTKPLLYQLKPIVKNVRTVIEVKPLLDQPVAFQIELKKGSESHLYHVDWSGNISRQS